MISTRLPAADPSRTPAAHPSDGFAGRPVACSNDRHRAQSPVGNAGGKNDRALARPTVCFRDAADRLADQGLTVGVGASPFRATDRSPLTRGGPELGDRNLTPRHATFQPALDCCVIALGKWFPRRRLKKLIAVGATVVAMGALAGPAAAAQVNQPPNQPPNCERGQTRAAANAFKKGKADQFAKHTLKAAACLAGKPPRSRGAGRGL